MKTKTLVVTLAFLANNFTCQSLPIKKIFQATALTVTGYTAYKLCIAQDKDSKKWQRIVRQDKDAKLAAAITNIRNNCKHEACTWLAQTLEQYKSTLSQILKDKAQEGLEIGQKIIENSGTAPQKTKTTEKIIQSGYKATKETIDKACKSTPKDNS